MFVEQYSGTWILIAVRKSKKEAASRQRRTKDPEQLPQGRIKIPGPRIKEPAFQTAVKARACVAYTRTHAHAHARLLARSVANVNYDSRVLAWDSRVYRGESGEQVVQVKREQRFILWYVETR